MKKKLNPELSDDELLRYSRTIFLDSIDYAGQKKLKNSKALVIGAGGLGSAALYYLASSGVGTILISDGDQVELSNLARQIIHFSADIGKLKTESAKAKINQLNPEIEVIELPRLKQNELKTALDGVDVVLDCSDNFETRFALNQAAREKKVPLVSGAAIRYEAQVMCFSNQLNTPCYQCLFPNLTEKGIPENCVDCGVFPPLVGLVGSLQAAEAIKILLQCGNTLEGKMLIVSLFDLKFREIKINQDPHCPICFS